MLQHVCGLAGRAGAIAAMGRMGKEFLLLLVTAAIAPASVVASAQDIAAIIDDCESCHGRGGASAWKDIPVIGGMSAFYLDAQLHAYQDGYRPCGEVEYPAGPERGLVGDMCEAVDGLDATQIAAIADYFAEQVFIVPDQQADRQLAEQGEELHERLCAKCHSEGGGLAFDDAGILAGQWRGYLQQSFRQFRAGERWQPEKMAPTVEQLDDRDVEALVEFYVTRAPVE
ncbi:MAG: hypothetical protein CMQ43_03590 [Gammaproteobacteria bacterium]|nr:hypothetical protein [Gammaproteobacteria bacterium]